MAGRDPRFIALATVSPYIVLALGGCDVNAWQDQTAPMFMISGGADTIATPSVNQQPIFDGAPIPIVWGTYAPADHLQVLGDGGAYRGPLTAWFRWRLMDDPNGASWFKKSDCSLCSAPDWSVQYNDMWTE